MILADAAVGSHELIARINKRGVPCQKDNLPFGDFMFEGKTDQGNKMIGIERKKVPDMVDCIDSARYAGHQQIGMSQWFRFRFLIIEGIWKAHHEDLNLMHVVGKEYRPFMHGRYPVRYSKLFRYLISAQLTGGAYVIYSPSDTQTVINICEIYHFFQKRWEDHTAMQAIYVPPVASFTTPTLLLEFLSRLHGLGSKLAPLAAKHFSRYGGTPAEKIARVLKADEVEWLMIEGVNPKVVGKIMKELHEL